MIKAVIRFYSVPKPYTRLADLPDVENLKYYSFWVVATPWPDSPGGGVASVLPLTTDSASIAGLKQHYPVQSGGEHAAYQQAIQALKSNVALSAMTFVEQKEASAA